MIDAEIANALRGADGDSYNWSRTAASRVWNRVARGAYFLVFYDNVVRPDYGPTDRRLGFPLR